jgi:hypothetical protein
MGGDSMGGGDGGSNGQGEGDASPPTNASKPASTVFDAIKSEDMGAIVATRGG